MAKMWCYLTENKSCLLSIYRRSFGGQGCNLWFKKSGQVRNFNIRFIKDRLDVGQSRTVNPSKQEEIKIRKYTEITHKNKGSDLKKNKASQ